MSDLGDFKEDVTLISDKFNTYQADGTPIALAGTPSLEVYKSGNATPSTAGVTLSVDYSAVVGLNNVAIDASADAFYEPGKDYTVVIAAGTVDGVSVVGREVTSFSIENRFMRGTDLALLAASYTAPDNAGIDANGVAIGLLNDFDPATEAVSLAATGLDAIVSTAAGMVEIAKATWDRALTGATHNIPTSAGRRLRGLQDFGNYLGAVNIDTINGTAGVVIDENGTMEAPSLLLADALIINTTVNYNAYRISPASIITLSATTASTVWEGKLKANWTLNLNTQDISNSTFSDATVSGIATGTGHQIFIGGRVGAITLPANTHVKGGATVFGTQTLPAGDIFYEDVRSGIAGLNAPIYDFAAVGNTNLNLRAESGGANIFNMGQAGTDTMSIEGDGQLIIDATCIGGTIAIRGSWDITGAAAFIAAGGVIVRDDSAQGIIDNAAAIAALPTALQNAAAVWEDQLTTYVDGQAGARLRRLTDLAGIEVSINDPAATNNSFITDQTGVNLEDVPLKFLDGANAEQSKVITTHNTTTGEMTFDEAFDNAPADGANAITGMHTHSITQIKENVRAEMDAASIILDAIFTDTGTLLPADIAAIPTALENVTAILTTQMPEDYAAKGVEPNILQAIYAILQYLYERKVAGTIETVDKLDGVTAAITSTLDDGTNPTDKTRAT